MYSGIGLLDFWHAVERVSEHCARGEKEENIDIEDNAIARVPSRATLKNAIPEVRL
jgi:hypothetical protein